MDAKTPDKIHLAIFLHDLRGGGAERVTLQLAKSFADVGVKVSLVAVNLQGEYLKDVPRNVKVVDLAAGSVRAAIPAFVRFIKECAPDLILSGLTHVNIAAIVSRFISRRRVPIIVTEHNQISKKSSVTNGLRAAVTYAAVRFIYPFADSIVAVSDGVGDDLSRFANIQRSKIVTIYNPIVNENINNLAAQAVSHPWLIGPTHDVIVAVGRLHRQKGYDVLIEAFSMVKERRAVKLIILGEGEERATLQRQIDTLKLGTDVDLHGFVENPYSYMKNASLFVLSSRFEGLPTVLVEAMYCGTNIVSTNCPSGPSEILKGGIGPLVPVGNAAMLADAINQQLSNPDEVSQLVERASSFTVGQSRDGYLQLFQILLSENLRN